MRVENGKFLFFIFWPKCVNLYICCNWWLNSWLFCQSLDINLFFDNIFTFIYTVVLCTTQTALLIIKRNRIITTMKLKASHTCGISVWLNRSHLLLYEWNSQQVEWEQDNTYKGMGLPDGVEMLITTWWEVKWMFRKKFRSLGCYDSMRRVDIAFFKRIWWRDEVKITLYI